jgi:glycosyl transferase family 25
VPVSPGEEWSNRFENIIQLPGELEMQDSNLKILAINLERSPDRRKKLLDQLVQLRIPYEIIIGVDGKMLDSLPVEYDRKQRIKWYGYDLTPGEIGTFLSHRKAWSRCVELGSPCMILEDDVKILGVFAEAIHAAFAIQLDWDFMRFHGSGKDKLFGLVWCKTELFSFREELRDPSTLPCYLITPRGAEKLLEHSEEFWEAIDNYVEKRHRNKLISFSVKPYPVTRYDFPTTADDRGREKKYMLGRVKRSIMREFAHSRKIIWAMGRVFNFLVKKSACRLQRLY